MADTNDKHALERLLDEIVDCAVSMGKSDAMKGFGAFTEIDSISMSAMRKSISQKRAQILGHFDETATPPADEALAENAAIECLRACAQAMRIFDRPDTAAEVDRATDAISAALRARAVPEGFVAAHVKNLDVLVASIDRAESKGYLPDAIADAWAGFDYRLLAARKEVGK